MVWMKLNWKWMEMKRQGRGEPRRKSLFLEGKGSSEVQASDRDGKAPKSQRRAHRGKCQLCLLPSCKTTAECDS